MRVLFWSGVSWPAVGGIPVIAADLVASLAERGHDLHLVADSLSGHPLSRDPRVGVAVHRYPFLEVLRSGSAARILSLTRSISELERAVSPDLVLAFALTPSLFFHLQAQPASRPPWMVSLHGDLPFQAGTAQRGSSPQPTETDDPLAAGLRARRGSSRTAQSIVGRALQDADWVMTCSESCLREAVARYPFVAGKASVARNALRHDLPPPSRPVLDPPRLLYVGRLSREKGVDVAIAALPAVLERAPDARLKIAGEGPLRRDLHDLARQYGLAERVEFLGFVARDEVRGLMSEASIVVVPSRSEGFSLVALEAAQAGRPVVAARVGGIPEVVVDGETGLLVPAEEPAAFAAAILALLDDPVRTEAMAASARRRVDEVFRWSEYVDAYHERITALGRGR